MLADFTQSDRLPALDDSFHYTQPYGQTANLFYVVLTHARGYEPIDSFILSQNGDRRIAGRHQLAGRLHDVAQIGIHIIATHSRRYRAQHGRVEFGLFLRRLEQPCVLNGDGQGVGEVVRKCRVLGCEWGTADFSVK